MPYVDENIAVGLPQNSPFQVGLTVPDNGDIVERDVPITWPTDPTGSYVYYECAVGSVLDSGIVVHNRLPQVNNEADSLGAVSLDDPNLQTIINKGVVLTCKDQYTDIVQRMGHSRYWFRIWGKALRVGFQVPIPKIKKIGGVDAIPYDRNPQWAFNRIFPGGNYGGVILWHAEWSLWYTIAVPPINNKFPAADPSAMSSVASPVPQTLQAPFSTADSNTISGGTRIPTTSQSQTNGLSGTISGG